MTQTAKWVPMSVAARELGVSVGKLSSMGRNNEIETRDDTRDKRKRLVDIVALRALFGPLESEPEHERKTTHSGYEATP